MDEITTRDLRQHLKRLTTANTRELDRLLTDLLVRSYPTKAAQNS